MNPGSEPGSQPEAQFGLRAAEPSDAIHVARVHVRSWQVGYRGLISDADLDRLRPEERAAGYTFGQPGAPTTIVAERHGEICGFATFGRATTDGNPAVGELMALYVDPDWWRRSVGRRLIHDARRRLTNRGFTEAILWVLAGNERAERFYRSDGWRADGGRRTDQLRGGITVDELRYRRALP